MINKSVSRAALSAVVFSALAVQAFAAGNNQTATPSTPTVIETIEHAAAIVWGTLTHAAVVWGSHH